MFLKKIDKKISLAINELGWNIAKELQQETFGTLKSGIDVVITGSKNAGKTTLLVLHVIQQLNQAFEESPRALLIVQNRDKVVRMQTMFQELGKYTNLRIFSIHDHSDIDRDKNLISMGIDVIIGTPTILSEMFSRAGYNVNKLKIIAVDDFDIILKNKYDLKITRIFTSIPKVQRILLCETYTDKVALFADKNLVNPIVFNKN